MFKRWLSQSIILLSLVFAIISPANAAEDKIYKSFFSDVATSGYDVVAYFTESKPVKGSKKYQTKYDDATWYFSSQDHLDLFKANPEKYAPQYGGYCAWGVAKGGLYSSDPKNWNIYDGKLYLNYNSEAQEMWIEKKDSSIDLANSKWPKLVSR